MSATGEPFQATGIGAIGIGAAEAGATLLEMLVVVALLAMISGLVFANFRPALQRMALDAAGTELGYTLAQARATALRTSAAQSVELAEDGSAYAYGGRRVRLPASTRLRSDQANIRFSPNGLSDGARVELVSGARRLLLRVETDGAVAQGSPG